MTEAYPLQWPAGQPRTVEPEPSRFEVNAGTARDQLFAEIERLGGVNVVVSTDIPLRNDGLPYAKYNGREPDDVGVAVYFTYKAKPMCFACDKWNAVRDNMRAIQKTIDALRGIERWGSGDMMQQAFTGFALLEAPKPTCWFDVLNVNPHSCNLTVRKAYHERLKETHVDNSGDRVEMEAVIAAWKDYKKERTND